MKPNQDTLYALGSGIADACGAVPGNFRDLDTDLAGRELRSLLDQLQALTPARENVRIPDRTGPGSSRFEERGLDIEALVNVWQVCAQLDDLVKGHRKGIEIGLIKPEESLPIVLERALLLASRCLLSRMPTSSAAALLYRNND